MNNDYEDRIQENKARIPLTFGTALVILLLGFCLGFLACHELYTTRM